MNKTFAVVAAGVTGIVLGVLASTHTSKKTIENARDYWINLGEQIGREEALNDPNTVADAHERFFGTK